MPRVTERMRQEGRVRHKHEILDLLDRESAERLALEHEEAIQEIYDHEDGNRPDTYDDEEGIQTENQRAESRTTALYECVLDLHLERHKRLFYERYDDADEQTREDLYPYLRDEFKEWLDEREENGR